MMRIWIYLCLLLCPIAVAAEEQAVVSPDGNLRLTLSVSEGRAMYQLSYEGMEVVRPSRLGLITSSGNLSEGLHLEGVECTDISRSYTMRNGKMSHIDVEARRMVARFSTDAGSRLSVEFVVENHDVAMRYLIDRAADNRLKRTLVREELTSFRLPDSARTFLCPQIGPETGWERTKPSYEEEYMADAPMAQPSKYGLGYTFPCLFRIPSDESGATLWLFIGETGVGSNYCGSHLSDYHPVWGYQTAFPHEGENGGYGSAFASIPLPGATPWRTLTVGTTLAPIVESTIAWDVVEEQYAPLIDYRPGRYTWSWLIWQDKSINYDDQVRFIDLAAAMGYEYCLVDNLWDVQIGRERVAQLAEYARQKGVGLMLWYNSNGHWNDAPQTPRNLMHTAIAREREMQWLESIGVKGIKVDFFGGDKQETMRLYEDILSDANRHGLQVIFHGCTLPRGWERMFPNFVGAEAVLASENVYFTEHHARREGFELTMHPFVRNAYAAMDWGGVIMNRFLSRDNRSRHPRHTTDVFEMASGVTNQCAINCVAIQPNNLEELPAEELDFLRRLPTRWDETRLVEGYPGRYVVMARRTGDRWLLVGLNGTDQPMRLELDLSRFFTSQDPLVIYNDKPRKKGEQHTEAYRKPLKANAKGKTFVTMQPLGGFIIERQ